MKYWLCLLALIIFPIVSVYAETDNVEITVVDSNEDPINSWGLYIEIYQDDKDPIITLDQPSNPSYVSLGNGKYSIKVYRHDMFVGNYFLKIDDDSFENIRVPIGNLGGIIFTAYYADGKPIQGAKVEIFSYKGTKWAEDITGNDGRTERFWLQIPVENDENYYVIISLDEEISYKIPKFRFSEGYNDEIITTPWKSIVDDLIKIQLYKTIGQPVSGYDGKFIIELYDNNEKVSTTKVNNHGQASFSNLPVGNYFLRVLEITDDPSSEPTVWAIKEIFIRKNMDEIPIFGFDGSASGIESDRSEITPKIESPEETCNCVAFRLDNLQDYYLVDIQKELINLFLNKDAPVTVGIIGKNFGSDADLINYLKTTVSEHNDLITIGNHGGTSDITTMNADEQFNFIQSTNNNIYDFIGKKPTVFIPPFGIYNEDTVSALEKADMHYISSVSSFDLPPYSFNDESLLRFPTTASSGYIEQGRAWYGIPANQTFSDIKFSIRDHGFAVVLLHPHEYSKRTGWDFENQLYIPQYFELDNLIDDVRDYGLKIVAIDDIDREAQLFSKTSVPQWFKNPISWWTKDQISDLEVIQLTEYLIDREIIRVPQVENNDQFFGKNIPIIFKNDAKLWVQGKISDIEFVNSIKTLVKQGVIRTT